MYKNLIVPTDGTTLSVEMIGKAVAFAKAVGAHITFLHVQRDYAADPEGALLYAAAPAMFAEAAAGGSRGILAKAVAVANAEGVPCNAVVRTGGRPYEVILAVAGERGCDAIFMASHGRKGLKGRIVGSQTLKVLAEATIPVIVSTNEANAPASAAVRAIGIWQDEHRSLAAVIHALLHVVQCADDGAVPDFRLMKAMLYYIENFSSKMHHPKEDDYIFDRLQRRTGESSELIAELRRQHVRDHELVANLACTLAGYERDPKGGLPAFKESLQRFAEFTWQHMTMEEKVVLASAREHLTERDWEEIARAFSENGDPRFGDEMDSNYQGLFSRLLNLVPVKGDVV